jgi:hypothetical protein
MLLKKNSLRANTERRGRKRLGSMQGIRTDVACDGVVVLRADLASSSFIHARRISEGGIFATAKVRTLQELRMLARSRKEHQGVG